jgi:integrase
MQWSEVDLENRLWTLPPERTKQGRQHQVPLSNRSIELLKRQQEFSNGSRFVFSGYGQEPLTDSSMRSVLGYMGVEATTHGFRSSFRDWCGNETHFAREPVEHCLGHRLGNSVEQAYRRSDSLAKRRVILDHWAAFCNGDGHLNDQSRAAWST